MSVKYISIKKYSGGVITISDPLTLERWQSRGLTEDSKYYIFEPEKLTEVDISLVIKDKS